MHAPSATRLTILLALALLAAPAAAAAPSTAPADPAGQDSKPAAEAEAPPVMPQFLGVSIDPPALPDPSMDAPAFLQAVAEDALLQMQLGKLLEARATTKEVKELAHRLATNYTAIQVILTKLAGKQGAMLPATLSSADQALMERFASADLGALQQAYAALAAQRTAVALAAFKWQYDNATNEDVRSFAMQTAPIMGTHARAAEAVNAQVNKEEIRQVAEIKLAAQRAEEQRKAEEAAAAAQAAAKKAGTRRAPAKKTTTPATTK